MIKHIVRLFFIPACLLLMAHDLWALNIQHFRPSTGATKGYQVLTSDTLKQGQFSLGLVTNYGHNPLTMRISGQPNQNIVDHLAMADFLVDVAVFDWMMVHLDMPLTLYESIQATDPAVSNASNTGGKAGDLALRLKLQFFDAEKTSTGLGLAFVPQIDFPTGSSSKYVGDSSVSGSLKAVGDWQIHSNRFYMNVGYKFKDRETIGDDYLIVDDELLYGLGFQRPLVKKWDLDIIAEGFGSTSFAKNPRNVHRLPLEAMGLFQKKWLADKSLITTLGGGAGLTDGYGNPEYRIIFGIAYVYEKKPKPKPEPKPEMIEILDKIHFEFDRSVIRPQSYPVLDNVADVIKGDETIRKVQVEGHTDSVGSDAYNQKLSQRRSEAVVDYLVTKDVERDRLTSKGFGESEPIAPNDTVRGRAMNRRTEFRIIERSEVQE